MTSAGDGRRAWSQSRGPTGAFASVQRASLPCPAVEHSPAGARRLGDLYWQELVSSTFGLVRARVSPDAVVLRPVGIGPALLRFGRGEPTVTPDSVTCRFAILGGLLARTPGGWIAFTQTFGSPLEVRSEIDGFFPAPRDAASPSRLERRAVPTPADSPSRRPRAAVLRTPAHGGNPVKVAVLGATGMVGRCLVPLLAEPAMSWPSLGVCRATTNGVHNVAADVTDGEALGHALEGVDVVYYLVHSLGTADFRERDRIAAIDDGPRGRASRCPPDRLPRRSRRRVARPVSSPAEPRRDGEHLASGSVPVTTLRAAMVIGPGSAAFETIVALVDRLPGMICPRWVSTSTQPIALHDVTAYLVGVAGREDMLGESFDAGGPDVMTYREMIERIARIRGRRPLIVEVPVLSPRLSSWWLTLVTPVQSRVARPLIEGLRTPTVAHDQRLRNLVPLELTPFDEAARSALARREERARQA